MEYENTAIRKKPLVNLMWRYSFIIGLTLIGGYLALVGVLLIPIIKQDTVIKKFGENEKITEIIEASGRSSLEAIQTITTVFGPWIAGLVAFYFAGKQFEKFSDQMGDAQRAIASAVGTDAKRAVEGKTVKDVMVTFDENKHKVELELGPEGELTEDNVTNITNLLEARKDIRCFAVFTKGDEKIRGILTPTDIKLKVAKGKKLGECITDMVQVKSVEPNMTLKAILPDLASHSVLPVIEEEKIEGFVYRKDVFMIMGGIS